MTYDDLYNGLYAHYQLDRWLIWMTTTSVSLCIRNDSFFVLLFGSRRELEGVKKDVLGCPNKHRVIFPQKKTRMRHCPRFFSEAMTTLLQQFPNVSSNCDSFPTPKSVQILTSEPNTAHCHLSLPF